MLSVQSPGYAGMERFGVDAGLGSPPNHRRKMRSDSVQTHDILLSTDHSIITNKSDSHSTLLADNHHRHYCHHDHHEGIIRCPHHVALPDSDWIPSTDNVSLNLRNSYQAEITRSYIRPPPNKTALDVPFNFISDASTIHMKHQRSAANATTINNKSKHNPLAKFLLRISSPKSHENNSNNSTLANHNSTSHKTNIGNHSSSSTSSTSSTSSSNVSSASSSSSLPTSCSGIGGGGGGTTIRHHHEPSSKARSMTQTTTTTTTYLPPSYSESQLQYQHEQRLKFQPVTPSPSQICVPSSLLSLRTSPSIAFPNNNNCSKPKINKSRSLCNEINYNRDHQYQSTAMINSIVNNTAIVGCTSSAMLSPSSSSSTISMVDEMSSSSAASINDLSSINQIEYSINALSDSDISCMVSSHHVSSISPSHNHDV